MKSKLAFFVLASVFSWGLAYAQNQNSNDTVPEGMEIQRVGNVNLIVPKGARMGKNNQVLVPEGEQEYMARNVQEMYKRLDAMKEENNRMKGQNDKMAEDNSKMLEELNSMKEAYSSMKNELDGLKEKVEALSAK